MDYHLFGGQCSAYPYHAGGDRGALPEAPASGGAKVTRMGPSPHGLCTGQPVRRLVDWRLAHQSGGVFCLRIEDTDKKARR